MVPWRATNEGYVTPELLAWYGRFAEGQPGAIVVEATGIRDIPSGPLLRIGHDRYLDGLSQLVEVVHARSGGRTKLFIQLIDFLRVFRRPKQQRYLAEFVEISDHHRAAIQALEGRKDALVETDAQVRGHLLELSDPEIEHVLSDRELEDLRFGYRERVTDTDKGHIRLLPQTLPPLFSAAALRAREAGFHGIELHFAHAYTMASFLSGRNTRTDGYGGTRQGRARLPLEVFGAVRESVGTDMAVGCRYLCDEVIEDGYGVDDATYFGVEFARAGMDFISLSTGGKFEDAKQPKEGWAVYPYTGRSGYECMPTAISDQRGPFGRQISKQARIRKAIRHAGYDTPIVVAGGICQFDQAESILRAGQGDVVAAARQSLADPDWFRKVRLGRGQEVRRCIYTNYCEALDQKHKQVTCQLWDREALDTPGVMHSSDGKRRLVAPDWDE